VARSLAEAADEILRAVSDALSADLRPVCKTYQALGTPVILNCCECEDEVNGELSIHLRRLYDSDPSTLNEVQRVRPCKGGSTSAQFRLVLARCRPIINEHGELPPPETITDAALDQIRDTELLWQSLACHGSDIRIDDVSVDLSDPGMCSVIFADITVPVQIPALPDPGSA
jgi:hypothetical protein